MIGYNRLLVVILFVGICCVVFQTNTTNVKLRLSQKRVRGNKLVLSIHNKCPSKSTFSLVVNGRKVIACHNPTLHGATFKVPLQHYGTLKSVDLYKHTTRYGPLYIDKLEIDGKSLLTKMIFCGRQKGTKEDINLFHNDSVRWSELCASGLLIHQGRYNYRPERAPCPFI